MVRLNGKRIILREWRADEVDAMHRWLGDAEVTRFLSWGSATREDSENHLEEILAEQRSEKRRKFYLAIELKSTGRTIGDTGFTWVEEGAAEIGYFLEPAYWGYGYAVEAAALVIAHAFDLGAAKIVASCDARNIASERVMQSCGMVQLTSDDPNRRRYSLDRSAA